MRIPRIAYLLSAAAALLLLSLQSAYAADILPLSQVQKGMKGYGLTVFEGSEVEKFDVEILGVLHNTGPGTDLILARVDHPVIRRAGVIAGMSGSPVYIDGKVIGALSYSWQFAKEPVAGITPIEEMLKIGKMEGVGSAPLAASPAASLPAVNLPAAELLKAIVDGKTSEEFDKIATQMFGAPATRAMTGAVPIAAPLAMSAFDSGTISRYGKYLDTMGFMTVPAGAMAAGTSAAGTAATPKSGPPFRPGDPIGAVLLDGDFNVVATGTVTHVDGDRVYAFGHPFLDMGAVSFPMTQSEIVTVLPSLANSFKFASNGATVGTLSQDRGVGIMGHVGATADMIPIELTLDGNGTQQTYRVRAIRHPQLSPLILAMAADTVVANAQRAAGERTVLLDSEIRLKGFDQPIHLRDGWAGAQARSAIPSYLALISTYLMSNEFRDAQIESVKIHLRHDDKLNIAKLMEASIVPPADGRIAPGDTVKVRAVLKPFRGDAFTETFDVKVPENQTPGSAYVLVGSGSVMNQVDFMLVPPDPRSLEQTVAVLQRLRPSTDLTLGLYTSADGAVTSGAYLPSLPPSMRAVVSGDTTNRPQAAVKYYSTSHMAKPEPYIIDGVLKLDLNVQPRI